MVALGGAYQVASLSPLAMIFQNFVWRRLDEGRMTSKPAETYDQWRPLFSQLEAVKSRRWKKGEWSGWIEDHD